jgi:cell division protein FtsZ
MREGPLADLFRKTDDATDAPTPEGQGGRSSEVPPPPAPAPARTAPATPAPATPAGGADGPKPEARERKAPRNQREQRTADPRITDRRAPKREERGAPEPPPHPRETGYPHPSLGTTAPPLPDEQPRVPTPQERLRHAFSSDIPDNILQAPAEPDLESDLDSRAVADERLPWGHGHPVGHPVLRVVGVGGAGVNAVNRMVEAQVAGVEFLAINTDLQSLQLSTADITLHIGPQVTRGLGAGSNPDLGRAAAMEEYDKVKSLLKGHLQVAAQGLAH